VAARSGARPKPAELRLVDGTHRTTRHGDAEEAKKKVGRPKKAFNKPVMPQAFKGQAKWAWERYIKPAWWLDASREALAIAFCELWQKYRKNTDAFSAANHTQMRAYLNELGLSDERNRGGVEPSDDKDEFFGD
jgi:hypothetical protein